MNGDMYVYEPALGHGLKHDPIGSIVGPRPIGWISTRSPTGANNLAPYSFFNVFSYRPPIVAFSSVGRKDTIRNVEASGEFVVNLATRELSNQVNQTSVEVAPDVDEFKIAQLTPADCRHVAAPRVAESPVALECKAMQVQQLRDVRGAEIEIWMAFGEVVVVHIARRLLPEGIYDTAAAVPILRGGGPADYFEVTADARFKMFRPKKD